MRKLFRKILLAITLLGASLPLLSACSGGKDVTSNSFELYKQVNYFLDKCKTTGLDKQIMDKWMSLEGDKTVPFEKLTGKNGNLNVATSSIAVPFSYIYEGKNVGICMDYMYYFAKEYGYTVTVHDYSTMAGMIDAICSGKDMIAAAPSTITEERVYSIAFTKPYYLNQVINVTLKSNAEKYSTKESLAGKNIGCLTGTASRGYIEQDVPTANILEYNSIADLNLSLRKGDIQSYYSDSSTHEYVILTEKDITSTYVSDDNYYAFILNKFGYQTLSELNQSTISILEGSVYGDYLSNTLPQANKIYYKDITNCAQSVSTGKSQAFAADYCIAREMCKELSNFYSLYEPIGSSDVACVFPQTAQGDSRRESFNLFLSQMREDGSLNTLITKWINYDESSTATYIAYDALPNKNGVFKLSVDPTITPFVFIKDNRLTGLEIELFYLYCKTMGYSLKIEKMNFEALIPSLVTNDAAASMILVSEERKKSVFFSDPYFSSEVVLVTQANSVIQKSWWEKIGDSFYKTFIKEDRWKMFLVGIGHTLLICICAAIGGILIGTLLFMLCKDGNKLANILCKIYNSILHNIPVVVILMIFYYIIFGNSSINGIVVSIIAFSFTFSTSIFGMLKNSISAIDPQQFEAGYALGYRKNQTFFKIILPQASRLFYPQFSADIVSLLKETAVVGYIAVMDLTKVSDIIRSRTYEAFFPLLASAVIYFILAVLLVQLVKLIQRLTDPRKRKKSSSLKGVKQHD